MHRLRALSRFAGSKIVPVTALKISSSSASVLMSSKSIRVLKQANDTALYVTNQLAFRSFGTMPQIETFPYPTEKQEQEEDVPTEGIDFGVLRQDPIVPEATKKKLQSVISLVPENLRAAFCSLSFNRLTPLGEEELQRLEFRLLSLSGQLKEDLENVRRRIIKIEDKMPFLSVDLGRHAPLPELKSELEMLVLKKKPSRNDHLRVKMLSDYLLKEDLSKELQELENSKDLIRNAIEWAEFRNQIISKQLKELEGLVSFPISISGPAPKRSNVLRTVPELSVLFGNLARSSKLNLLWKTDFSIPNKLADLAFDPVGKTHRLLPAIRAVLQRQTAIANGQTGKTANFLIALHSAAGGGKSFYLDIIAGLGSDPDALKTFLDLLGDEINHKPSFLENIVGITVSYFPKLEWREEEFDNINEFLGWRILNSYFTSDTVDNFVRAFRGQFQMNAEDALNIIVHHETVILKKPSPHIFLCIDELIASGNAPTLITKIGALLDRFPFVTAFISTLDIHYVIMDTPERITNKTSFTSSGRPIEWLSVPPLPIEEVFPLFAEYSPESNLVLNSILCMANGHPRTLQRIKNCLGPALNVPGDLLKIAASSCEKDWDVLTPDLIQTALKGDPLLLSHEMKDPRSTGTIPLFSLITGGYYFNSINPKDDNWVVPRMSLFRIYASFLLPLEDKERGAALPSQSIEARKRFNSLLRMARMSPPETDGGFGGHLPAWLEEFHALWEDCNRIAFIGDSESTQYAWIAKDLYKIRSPFNEGAKEGLVFGHDIEIALTPNFSDPMKTFTPLKDQESLKKWLAHPSAFQKVFDLWHDNPGYDVMLLERDRSQRPVAVFIEVKSKVPSAKTDRSLMSDTVINKIRNCMDQFLANYVESNTGGVKGINDFSQLCIVFASFQKISSETITSLRSSFDDGLLSSIINESGIGGKPTVIVLQKESLLNLYTPTLRCSPAFYSSQSIKVMNDQPIVDLRH